MGRPRNPNKPAPKLRTPSELARIIEDLVWEKDISYMDAILMHCENNKLEVETVAASIKLHPTLRAKIQLEAENLNFLQRTDRLPV
jgi:Phage late-transcription coactivator